MASVLVLAILAACLAVAGAALHTVISERAGYRESVHRNFDRIARAGSVANHGETRKSLPALARIEERLRRAGIEPQRWHVIATPFAIVLVTGTGAISHGLPGALFALLTLAGSVWGFLSWRARKRRAEILEQLPGFLDHVVRAVQTGSSLPNGMLAATEETAEPIRSVFTRAVRQTRLGVSIEDALEQAASLHQIRELRILALSVRVSQRYGGSVRDVLGSIVAMIRQRERTRREFRAMTGETRLSAVLLAALPAVIAAYVMIVNPDYLGRMTSDEAGRLALYISGGLQVTGSLVLWRMVRSV